MGGPGFRQESPGANQRWKGGTMIDAFSTIAIAVVALAGAKASEMLRGRAARTVPCGDEAKRQVVWEYQPDATRKAAQGRGVQPTGWIPVRPEKAC